MDIKQALQEISDTGLTDQQIGDHIGAAQSIVTRLRNGDHSSTSYERGQKIMELHKKRVSKKAA